MRKSSDCASRYQLFLLLSSSLLSILAAITIGGCGGGGGSPTPPPTPSAQISLSASTIDFGVQPVQTSATGSLTISNPGDAALSVSSIQIGGAQAADFKVTSTLPMSVTAGGSAEVQFSFTPADVGTRAASLSISSNAKNTPPSVALKGKGWDQVTAASVQFTPNTASSGSSATVSISGTNTSFVQDSTTADFGPGITVNGSDTTNGPVAVTSDRAANVEVKLQSAAAGPRQVTISTFGHGSTATFFVTALNGGAQASAGYSQYVSVGSTVQLDGSRSTLQSAPSAAKASLTDSVPNTGLTYHWSFVSMPEGSSATISDPAGVDPTFVADKSGTYIVQLSVSDGTDGTNGTDAVTSVSTTAMGPVANAGADQFLAVGAKARLDGCRSFHVQGNALSYTWQFISHPSGSTAAFSDPNSVTPTFMIDMAGTYLVQLTVNDGQGNSSSDQVIISTTSVPPVADAGENQSVNAGALVQLDGSKSTSPMGDTLSYDWSFTHIPTGSAAVLADPSNVKPTFTADLSGSYALQLAVSDTHNNTSYATVLVSTSNLPPVAVAGPDQSAHVGTTIQLDGTQSHASGTALTYQWILLTIPSGSHASLSEPTTATPKLTLDKPGPYIAQLTVSDGTFKSLPSTTLILSTVPDLMITPSGLNFGNQLLNTTSNSSTVVISSTGTEPLRIGAISLAGTNAGDFKITAAALPIVLEPGDQTAVNVTFTPSALGSRAAQIRISDNTPAGTHSIALAGTGTAPNIAFSSSTLAFGNQSVGSSSTQTLTVSNTGTGDLKITNVALSGTNSAEFVLAAITLPMTIAADGNAAIRVTFTPAALGQRSAVLSFTDNASGSPHTVNLTGAGVQPALTLSPPSITFGNQLLGKASSPHSITITNSGTADLKISALALSGTNAAAFAFATPSALPITVAAGKTTTINVTFTPAALGAASATLTITSNAPGSPHSVALTGTGVQPKLSLSATTLAFAATDVGKTSSPVPLTLKNTGTADLTVSAMSLPAPSDFAFSPSAPQLPIKLSVGQSTTVNFVFTPTVGGARTSTLTITSDAGAPQTVAFSGTGNTPGIGFTPSDATLKFNSVLVGSSSPSQTLTITNTGTANLTITAISLGGSNASDFTMNAPAVPLTVAPSQSASPITVTFKPTATGSRSATITITHSAAGGTSTAALTGTGVAPAINVTPPSNNFGNLPVGTTGTAATFTIKNDGTADLHISTITLGGANSGDFVLTNPVLPDTIAATKTDTFKVAFKPTQAGARSATVTIASDASANPTVISITGTGTAPIFGAPSLAFGNQPLNSSHTLPLTISNTGTADLVITQVAVAPAAAPFTVDVSALPLTIAAGKTASLNVTFTPSQAIQYAATLTFTDNAVDSPQNVAVTGTGTQPVYSPSATSFWFGNVTVGQTSGAQQLIITNTGGADLKITNIQLSGTNPGDFAFTSSPLPITVTPNSTTTVSLTFKPTAARSSSAALQITDNASGSPHAVSVSGTGLPVAVTVLVTPTSLSFANQPKGTTSAAQTIAVKNTGSGNLQITNVTVSGTNASEFAFTTAPLPITVTPNSTTNISVTFTPAAAGARTAVLSIVDTAPDSPQTVALSGTATEPVFQATPTSMSFPSTPANTKSPAQNLSLKNTGTADLIITQIALTGTNASDFGYSAALPMTIPAGATSTVPVTFTPGDTGTRTASLQFTDNASGSPHTVGLTGTGTTVGTVTMPGVTVGQNLEFYAFFSLSVAPASNLTVTITSSDPSKVLLSNSATAAGSASITTTVTQGSTHPFPGFYVQGLASSGTAQLTISAPGYTRTTTTVTLTPSAVVMMCPGCKVGDSLTTGVASNVSLRVAAYRLNSDLTVPSSPEQPLRGGAPVSVSISSSNTAIGTIVGSPLTIAAGTTNGTVTFHPIAAGPTTLLLIEPAGFSTPSPAGIGTTIAATVTGPKINLNPVTVGYNMQVPGVGTLDTAPAGSLTVTLTSNNASVLLSTDPKKQGSASLALTVAAGQKTLPAYYVQALLGTGQAKITATATGYSDTGKGDVLMTPSAFLIAGPSGNPGEAFSTTTISPNSQLTLSIWRLDPSSNPALIGNLRGGITTAVGVTSGTTSVGTIVGTATFNPNDRSNAGLRFAPAAKGTTVLSVVQPSGFTKPTGNDNLTVTVSAPQVNIQVSASVIGANLQIPASGELTAPANQDNFTVTIKSDNSGVLLSTSATSPGTDTINLVVPKGTGTEKGSLSFYVQGGPQTSGTANLTATVTSTTGWTPSSVAVSLAPSGFVLRSPNGIGADFSTYVNQTLAVQTAQLDPDTKAVVSLQPLRAGADSVTVFVTSSNTSVGTITGANPLIFTGSSGSASITFNALGSGSTTLSITPTPTGYTQPLAGTSLTATVSK